MSRRPKIQRMVVFKHGVAYLERSGPADGPFDLSFDKDEMNDVLKSLVAWVEHGEGRVTSIAFEKPEDPALALARRRLDVPVDGAWVGLFTSFRGRRVRVETKDGVAAEGEILGFEDVPTREGAARRVVLRVADDRLAMVALEDVVGASLLEAATRADLALLVDRTRAGTAGDRRAVTIRLDGRASDLRVSYVVPAPVWRVTYRLALVEGGARLSAWSLVHNPVDEDLEDISLTLTTGQPVSFEIDLYHPRSVRRAKVQENDRALAAPPPAYASALPPASRSAGAPPGVAPAPMMAPPLPRGGAVSPAADTPRGLEGALGGAPDAAEVGANRGEFFEFQLPMRFSLKRGGAAMVPLFSARLEARKERVWRQGAGESPDLVLTFENRTGAVLEEGAAIVYEANVYAGEAMVPYRARGAEVKVGYAKDLAVRCRRGETYRQTVSRVALGGARGLVEESRAELWIELTAESDHAEEVEVIFELPKTQGRSFAETSQQPFESTATHHRFRLPIEPRAWGVLEIVETWPERRRLELSHVAVSHLENWVQGRVLERSLAAALAPVLELWTKAAELDHTITGLERARASTLETQKQLTAQLSVLKEAGPEGELRVRHAQELAASQDTLSRLQAGLLGVSTERDRIRHEAEQRLATLHAG